MHANGKPFRALAICGLGLIGPGPFRVWALQSFHWLKDAWPSFSPLGAPSGPTKSIDSGVVGAPSRIPEKLVLLLKV